MTRFGYTLMTEQAGPRALVEHAVRAEQAGFTDMALVQVGGESQEQSLAEVAEPLLKELRRASS